MAIDASGLLANEQVAAEGRVAVHAGVWMRQTGIWQLFALGFFGNDVGVGRRSRVTQLGVGLRWSY